MFGRRNNRNQQDRPQRRDSQPPYEQGRHDQDYGRGSFHQPNPYNDYGARDYSRPDGARREYARHTDSDLYGSQDRYQTPGRGLGGENYYRSVNYRNEGRGYGSQQRYGHEFGPNARYTEDFNDTWQDRGDETNHRPMRERDMHTEMSGTYGGDNQYSQRTQGQWSDSHFRESFNPRNRDAYRSQRNYNNDYNEDFSERQGKGPKNYRRSDERIRKDVGEAISMFPHLDASNVEISVSEGEVTFTGTIESRRMKRCLEDAIDHVRGVKDVRNEVRVSADRDTSGDVDTAKQARSSDEKEGRSLRDPRSSKTTSSSTTNIQ